MSMTVPPRSHRPFHHEAFLYAGTSEFVAGATEFIEDGLRQDEPVLVMVPGARLELLRTELSDLDGRVQFVDMTEVGRNPARIIPAWHDFVSMHATEGGRLRGIGEPVWAGRSPAELVECYRHEALLNFAFDSGPEFWLLCPYDTTALEPASIDAAHRAHPFVFATGERAPSDAYQEMEAATFFDTPLPPPPDDALTLKFSDIHLRPVRQLVLRCAEQAGLADRQRPELLLSVTELVTNSIRHAGGRGSLAIWIDDDTVICEVQDAGQITEPLVGRELPHAHSETGRGLWVVNQVCDLVQIRSSSTGTVIRLHMRGR